MQSEPEELQELTFNFSRFSISVQVRVTERFPGASGSQPGPDFELVASEGPAIQFSSEVENQVLAASTPAEYAALDLGFLSHFERRLTGSHTIWTPKARVARAFKAGLIAFNLLGRSGPTATETPAIPFRNTIYLILRSPSLPQGGWTLSYQKFIDQCGGNQHGAFHSTTVCHAFATRTEADIYLVGARKQWPQQLP